MSGDYNRLDRRVKTVEEAVQLLTQMALRADERIDAVDERVNGFDSALNNLTVKMEALVDAHIRIEERLTAKVEALAEARIRNENELSAELKILAAAQGRTEAAMTRLDEAMTHLAETAAQTNQRLDAFIAIVQADREGRSGK